MTFFRYFMLITLSYASAVAAEVTFPLIRDGQPVANVVVAGKDKNLGAAVGDFVTYLKKMTGADLAYERGTADLPGPTLHLGETDLFDDIAAARDKIIVDGFVMAKIGEDLIVAGNLPQGTANGLYTILQDQFGVRWYFPGPLWEIIPEKKALTITYEPNAPGESYLENPAFMERALWGGPLTEAFGRRMRMTQRGTPLPFVGTGHHLNRVVNPKKHGDHPEYFAYWDGRRHVEHDVHPCFTHPDMFEIFMDDVREGGNSFGVNDNLSACKCDRCLEVDGDLKPYLGMYQVSNSYCQLIARVAEQTAKEFPDRRLGIFAYQQTNAPPTKVDHLGKNVDVVLCQDTAQYFDPEVKEMDQEMSAEWVRKSGHVRFYGYVGIDYWTPRYFPGLLEDQLKHLHRVGVVGYGTHSVTMHDSAMPLFYLLHQMLWNPEQGGEALIDRMLRDLYGEASGPIAELYDHWEACWMRQDKGRWFWGMDNFRGEMQIYTWDDIERGKTLLDKAARLASDPDVRRRIDYLQSCFAFTYASSRAHAVSTEAIRWAPTDNYEDALEMSKRVTDAWADWYKALVATEEIKHPSLWGWYSKTFRVRAWGLKQQMRDASIAPLVRWICAHEGKLSPRELRNVERLFASSAVVSREQIESTLTEKVGAAYRKSRADALRSADVFEASGPPRINGGLEDWPGLARIEATDWVFHLRPENPEIGKYDEPLVQDYVDPPFPSDQSMRWQCTWTGEKLFIRVVVTDDMHVQKQPAPAMWKEDSLQIAFNPNRDDFVYDLHSWDYIWGGYRGFEIELGISLHGALTDVEVFHRGRHDADADLMSHIDANAARHDGATVYEIAVDWKLIKGFSPAPEKSLGICLVVNDVDDGPRRSATYGAGVIRAKRATEFASIRLVGRPR